MDPYAVLGVRRGDDAETIRKTYKKLARKFHPDLNKEPKAADRFKEINAAYDVLGDEKKRALWDEFGEVSTRPGFDEAQARAFKNGGFGGGGFGGGGFGGAGGGVNVEDLLGSLFGAGGGGGFRAARGRDRRADIRIDFMTSILGGEREITLQGSSGPETFKVRIPAGVKDGGKLRLKGKGLPPPQGGPCGDLHLHLHVDAHPLLRREGDDLEMDLPVTIHEAIVGAQVTVPTPTGSVNVKVPPNAKPGSKLRLRNRGVQKKVPGHLYLVIRPTPPQTEDARYVELAKQLDEAYEGDLRGELVL